jgi:TonB family protein
MDYQGRPGAGPKGVSRRAPHYPDALRASEVSGRVIVTFAIDTLGQVIHNSARIEAASRPEFGDAVCDWLQGAQFEPIRRDGRPIIALARNMLGTFELTR